MNEFVIYSLYPDEGEIGCDAWGYYVEFDGEIIVEYGDDYHYKGFDKSHGFIEGYAYAKRWKREDYTIRYCNKIDSDLY